MIIYGHVICSILRPLRSWASSSSLSSPASGRGRAAQGSRFTCSPSAYSPRFLWRAQTHGRRRITSMCHDAIPRLRLSALPPFLFFEQNRQAAAIRHRAIPFHRLLPRHFVSGPSVSPAPPGPAGRPSHFTSPASSIYKSSSSTPSFCSPSLSRTGKPRPPGPFQALHPGTPLPGPYFLRTRPTTAVRLVVYTSSPRSSLLLSPPATSTTA